MIKIKNNYPSFDFTIEGFEKLRKYSDTITNIEDKIKFLEQQIEKYGREKDKQKKADDIDFSKLLLLERDYWKYIIELNEKLKIKKALEQAGQEDSTFSPEKWLEKNKIGYLVKVDFTRDDLFDFDEAKITKVQRDLWKRSSNMFISSKYDSLIYQMFVFKEFVVKTTLDPNSLLERQKAGYKEILLGLLKLLKDEVDIGLYNQIGK